MDDGSTDGSLKIAQNYESESVKVVHQSNQGSCAARNMAFSLCTGDYIQYLDSDDILLLKKLRSN